MLYSLLKPLLFSMDAERCHRLALDLLDKTSFVLPDVDIHVNPTEVMGITFPNKVGLAAGLDKNAEHLEALGKLGFGFIEVGTVTPRPQQGNAKPRLFRLPEHQAIINRMGFNNVGVNALIENLKKTQYKGVLGINIGKNKDTPNEQAEDDYLLALEAVYPYADYVTVNISSPNTAGLRDLQKNDSIKRLIGHLKEKQRQLSNQLNYKPIVIKIAPDLTDEAVKGLASIFKELVVDGVIATNTTIDKSSVSGHRFAGEQGGLSGLPVKKQSTHIIKLLADELPNTIPIIGVGGISSVSDAIEKINAGASLVQIYSGLIYEGPRLVKQLSKKI